MCTAAGSANPGPLTLVSRPRPTTPLASPPAGDALLLELLHFGHELLDDVFAARQVGLALLELVLEAGNLGLTVLLMGL